MKHISIIHIHIPLYICTDIPYTYLLVSVCDQFSRQVSAVVPVAGVCSAPHQQTHDLLVLLNVGHLQSDSNVQAAVSIVSGRVERLGRIVGNQFKDKLEKVKVLSLNGIVQWCFPTFAILE